MSLDQPHFLGQMTSKKVIYGGFALALSVILVIGFFILREFGLNDHHRQRVSNSWQILLELDNLLLTLQNAETGQRGYLLTGDDTYLEPYNSAAVTLDGNISAVRSLTADNAVQQAELDRLQVLVRQKMAELQQTIELASTASLTDALALVTTNNGKLWMDEIRQIIQTMTSQQTTLLAMQREEALVAERSTFTLFVVGTILTIAIVVGIFRQLSQEMSSRIQVERELRQSQDFIRQASEMSPSILYVYNLLDNRIVFMNEAGKALFGNQTNALSPQNPTHLFEPTRMHPDDEPVHSQSRTARQQMQDGEVIESEFRFRIPSGEWRWFYSREVIFSRAVDGTPKEVLGGVVDITARKLLEQQEKQRADILKVFIENASHDLNTPITILGTSLTLMERYNDQLNQYAEQLLKPTGSIPQQTALEIATLAHKSREKLNNLEIATTQLRTRVGDMLSMVRLEHETQLAYQPHDLNQLIERAIANYQQVAAQKNIILHFAPAPEAPLLMADGEKMTRAIANVLLNAITYSHENATVNIIAAQQDQELELIIEDTGIGIAEADLPHVFERFFRADQARSLHTGGMGLGLAMTRQVVEAHGGSIAITSQLNQGTRVRITFPASRFPVNSANS